MGKFKEGDIVVVTGTRDDMNSSIYEHVGGDLHRKHFCNGGITVVKWTGTHSSSLYSDSFDQGEGFIVHNDHIRLLEDNEVVRVRDRPYTPGETEFSRNAPWVERMSYILGRDFTVNVSDASKNSIRIIDKDHKWGIPPTMAYITTKKSSAPVNTDSEFSSLFKGYTEEEKEFAMGMFRAQIADFVQVYRGLLNE